MTKFDFVSVYKAVDVFKKSLELLELVRGLTDEEYTLVIHLFEQVLKETKERNVKSSKEIVYITVQTADKQ